MNPLFVVALKPRAMKEGLLQIVCYRQLGFLLPTSMISLKLGLSGRFGHYGMVSLSRVKDKVR